MAFSNEDDYEKENTKKEFCEYLNTEVICFRRNNETLTICEVP